MEDINFIAADIVEVAPAYDTNAELTTMAAADVLYEVMSLMVRKGPLTVKASERRVSELGNWTPMIERSEKEAAAQQEM